MNYIVDPSWVYWMNISNVMKPLCLVIGVIGIGTLIIALPIFVQEAFDDDDYATIRKWAIPIASVSIILILAGVFIPSKETLITMKVAELATKENVALTAQQLKEIVDYIISALKELR
jgi:hypothetical protein